MLSTILAVAAAVIHSADAVGGGASGNAVSTYTASRGSSVAGGASAYPLKNASYEYTGMGTAECNVDFGPDGSLIFAPAYTLAGVGIAKSFDMGKTFSQILPGGSAQPRTQPVFRQENGRQFFWSSNPPGLQFEYSDDGGNTFSAPLNGSHFDNMINDWAKLVTGPPVYSHLSNGAKGIMYLSAPSLISTPIPLQPLGPVDQYIMKSTDKGSTWTVTKGMPTLNPTLSGGACSGLLPSLAGQELIIWGDGFVMPNGTVVFGLRRCQALSLAFSDDEGDSWRLVDVPNSHLVPFVVGDLTYLFDGNTLVPEPISIDNDGNIFAIWVDVNYVLQMSVSRTNGSIWSSPVVIAAPNSGPNSLLYGPNLKTYLPVMRQHPTQVGRAALAYYASPDNGTTYNGLVAETGNLLAANPVFSSIQVNPISAPLQHNMDQQWDQGYGDPLYDLVEFADVRYIPNNNKSDIVAAFARRMCTAPSQPPQTYPPSSCVDGWDYTSHADSAWQGFLGFVHH